MRPSIATIVLFFVAACSPSVPLRPSEPCVAGPSRVNAAIGDLAQRMHGAENCASRKISTGDLDGDGKPETAIAFTIEGMCFREGQQGSPAGSCGGDSETFLTVLHGAEGSPEVIEP